MKRLIGLHADRFAKIAQKPIDLCKYLARDVRRLRLRDGRRLVERPYIEERDLRRFGEKREPDLFRIAALYLRAALVDPSAGIPARLDVLKIADDGIAVILLQVLIAGRIPGLRARVNLIEVLRLSL